MNRKITALFLAISAAVSLLTGCSEAPVPYESITQPSVVYSGPSDTTTSVSDVSEYSTASEHPTLFYSSPSTSSYLSSSTSSTSSAAPIVEKPPITSSTTETTPSVTPARDAPYRPYALDTKSEEFVAYTTGNSELNFSSYYTPYLFDFRSHMAVGYSLNDTDNPLAVEADYGLKGEFNGSIVTIQTYNHTDKVLTVTASYLEALDASINTKITYEFSSKPDYSEAKNLPNGLYRASVTFSNYTTSELYFLVNGDEYLFCQMIMASKSSPDDNHNITKIRARRAVLHNLLAEYPTVTPENSLDIDIIKYPYEDMYWNGKQIWRCDTMRWAELSDTLVDSGWSNERKAYVICDWMSQNLAYDRYVRDVLHGDRDSAAGDFMGEYSVWNLRAGVCRDFGQILAIMLRRQGIPAEVIANDTHLWNIVYLNGQWMEVDICLSNTKYVNGVDTTVRYNENNSYCNLLSMIGQTNNDYYGTSLHKLLYRGQENFDESVLPAGFSVTAEYE